MSVVGARYREMAGGWPREKKKKKWAWPKATVPLSNYSKILKWV
jgi:hypothetical protein